MTEAEWLGCETTESMLRFLRKKASSRKLRLVACACVRRIRSPEGCDDDEIVMLCERFADDHHGIQKEVRRFASKLGAMGGFSAAMTVITARNNLLHASAVESARIAAYCGTLYYSQLVLEHFDPPINTPQDDGVIRGYCQSAAAAEAKNQTEVIRDVFGNPFRPVAIDPAWNNGTVSHLAQAIYDERALDRMPILADALEEAGCTNQDIIEHCRGPGPHVRGCWVVDLLLGKE